MDIAAGGGVVPREVPIASVIGESFGEVVGGLVDDSEGALELGRLDQLGYFGGNLRFGERRINGFHIVILAEGFGAFGFFAEVVGVG